MPVFKHERKLILIILMPKKLNNNGTAYLQELHAILVPGGFGERGVEGKIKAVQYAREHKIPYLGICLGMQIAVIEFARIKPI